MSFYHIRSIEGAKYKAVIHCSVLVLSGLEQGEYRRMKEHLWLDWTNRGMNLILTIENRLTIEKKRSQNNNFFCSRIFNLSFNGLTYNTRILFIVNLIFTDGIRVFLNTLTKKIEANCKITFFFVVE